MKMVLPVDNAIGPDSNDYKIDSFTVFIKISLCQICKVYVVKEKL